MQRFILGFSSALILIAVLQQCGVFPLKKMQEQAPPAAVEDVERSSPDPAPSAPPEAEKESEKEDSEKAKEEHQEHGLPDEEGGLPDGEDGLPDGFPQDGEQQPSGEEEEQ